MTSPVMATPPRPEFTVDPPRRTFGSLPKSLHSPTGVGPTTSSPNGSPTPTRTTFLIPPAEPQRTRSASSTSSEAIETAATKAQAWLQGWAPKGEGRGRDFLTNTLSGVAGVASTVGHGINGAVTNIGSQLAENGRERVGMGSRPSSYTSPTSSTPVDGMPTLSRTGSSSPPIPTYSVSTPHLPLANPSPVPLVPSPSKRIVQPSNLSRLGSSTSTTMTSPTFPSPNRPSISHPTSTTSLPPNIPRSSSTSATTVLAQPHGLSHLNPHNRSSSHSHAQFPSSQSRQPSYGARSPTISRSSSVTAGGPSLPSRSPGMPYKIGFQPAGVRNDRTGEFTEDRRKHGEEREKEEGRLGRRWAKIVDLHFNPTIPIPSANGLPSLNRSPSTSISLSLPTDKRRSLLSMDGALDALKPKEMWKGLRGVAAPANGPGGDEARKRAAEQAIVKWEDDAEAKKCRICLSSFSLSNRKHHCRLCGRIVCSLPPTPEALLVVQIQLLSSGESSASLPPGTRREKCSCLLVADWKTGRGEEVDEGFVGWMKMEDDNGNEKGLTQSEEDQKTTRKEKRKSRLSVGSPAVEVKEREREMPLPQQPKEVQVKGVRLCKECWAVVSRKQKIQDRQRVNGFARLYQSLRSLQAEIEEVLPDYEEQMDMLTSAVEPRDPPAEAVAMHKHLLTLFVQYEHLSKRISNLPCDEGGSQAKVQSAVARSAAMFLGKEMVKVQALPKLQKRAAEAKRKSMAVLETTLAEQLKMEGVKEDQADDVAIALQPLLEQEAQLEVMVADANAQRKYEDGKALAEALGDIRLEIGRVTQKAIN